MSTKEQIMDILMNYLPKEGVSKTRDKLVELFTQSVGDGDIYQAVGKYIEELGGKVAVMGGVEVMQYPDDLKYNYRLCFKVTGKKPYLQFTKDSRDSNKLNERKL